MEYNLNGKVILITGANSGIGKAASIQFANPRAGEQTGGYWDAPNVAVKANKHAYNRETQKRLWDVSEQLIGG